jgi:hypothetical protein
MRWVGKRTNIKTHRHIMKNVNPRAYFSSNAFGSFEGLEGVI